MIAAAAQCRIHARRRLARDLALLAVVCVGSASLALAETTSLGVFKDWTALTFDEQEELACMMWSQPKNARGGVASRGEVFVFVTHRPGARSFGSVTFDSGYALRAASTVDVTIEGERFTLPVDGSSAWTRGADDDARMVKAMRAGLTMVVEGVSSQGERTTDTYSLRGFTAAYKAISKACN